MTFSLILAGITAVVSAITLVSAMRSPASSSRGWVYISVGMLIVTIALVIIIPAYAGYISIGLYALFGLVPTRGFQMMQEMTYQGDYAGARRQAKYLRWLHPFRDWKWQELTLLAYQRAEEGDLAEAKRLLAEHEPRDRQLAYHAGLYAHRLNGDWRRVLAWLKSLPPDEALEDMPEVLLTRVRALGETGDLNGMVQAFQESQARLALAPVPLAFTRLFLFAFCGRKEIVAQLLDLGPLAATEPGLHELWLGTAEMAAGDTDAGHQRLEPLLQAEDHLHRRTAEQRLSQGVAVASECLTSDSQGALDSIVQEWSEQKPGTDTNDVDGDPAAQEN